MISILTAFQPFLKLDKIFTLINLQLHIYNIQKTAKTGRNETYLLKFANLGAFYMIMQIIPESMNQIDGIFSNFSIGMSWLQY